MRQIKEDGTTVLNWGLPAPVNDLTWELQTGTLTVYYGRKVAYAWESSTGHVSNIHITETEITPFTDKKVVYSVPTTNAPPDTTYVRVYETLDGIGIYYYSGKVTYGTSTYESQLTEEDLVASGEEAVWDENFPPPAGRIVVRHKGRIWVTGIEEEGSFIYCSGAQGQSVGVSEESFSQFGDPTSPRRYSIPGAGEAITGAVSTGDVLWLFTDDTIYYLYGDSESTFAIAGEPFFGKGTKAHRSIVRTPKGVAWFTPDKKVYLYNGQTSEPVEISFPITPDLVNVKPETVVATPYSYGTVNWVVFSGQLTTGAYKTFILDLTSMAWQFQSDLSITAVEVWDDGVTGELQLMAATSNGKVMQVVKVPVSESSGIGPHPEATFSLPFLSPQGIGSYGKFRWLDYFTTNPDLSVVVRVHQDYVVDPNGGVLCEIQKVREYQFRVMVPDTMVNSSSLRFDFTVPLSDQLGGIYALRLGITPEVL
jgi:hypothetical protein